MPKKNKSRKKKGAGIFDFLKTGESKSYTKKRCKEYENEITKLEKRIDELKAKQEEYKCLGGDMMTDNPMQQSEFEPEPDINPEPEQVDVEIDSSDEEEDEEDEKPQMQPLYKNDAAVKGVLDEVDAPEDRRNDNKDSIAKTITKGLTGGRRRRRKSRRKSKRKSKKRRKSRKKKSRKRRRRKSRR
jgi:hypothetical protein